MKEQLALYGGPPVRGRMLSYGRQWINEQDIEAVTQILRSDFLTTGPVVGEFEQAIARYVGAKYAVSFSSGTAALHGAVFAAGINEDDEVITTPMTFAASANCVLYQKGRPVFADIDPETGNIDPYTFEKSISARTRAIIPVDYTGRPVPMQEILKIADKYGLTVIEDAAHAFGASYGDTRIGSLADMTMFSFHPVKHITTGEGGIITTNSSDYYERLLMFRTHGITKDGSKLIHNEGAWYHEMQELGYNYRMNDIQASLGISQLRRSAEFLERRRALVKQYQEGLADLKEIILPSEKHNENSSWHLYVVQLRLEELTTGRKEIFEAIQAENIGVNVHYIPVYLHPYYARLGYESGICPQAENWYEKIITLPLFPLMTNEDVQDVISAVKKVLRFFKNRN